MTLEQTRTLARTLMAQTRGRITDARINTLGILLEHDAALSHQEIEARAQQQGLPFDRVTLYRALDWLVRQKLAHRIAAPERGWLYNAQPHLSTPHAHFHCTRCDHVYCLENLQPALLFNLPPGYQLESVELSLKGACPACATK
ncbi:MAG: transcriptional repressor [Thiothrix sp.]|nr:transcriptional repressor [Thiothrix sp.]HPE60114.1 transcriptional repressor [Thiolinea sp.]